MITFKEQRVPEQMLTTLTAYLDERTLRAVGKDFTVDIVQRLIKETIALHRMELQEQVRVVLGSSETKEYIRTTIREMVDKLVEQEVQKIINGKIDL